MSFSSWRAGWKRRDPDAGAPDEPYSSARKSSSGFSTDGLSEDKSSVRRLVLLLLAVLLVVLLVVAWLWSREPDQFDVVANAQQRVGDGELAIGATTTATLLGVAETLLEKPGGLLSNDVVPPGVWLDNIPAWEFGVITQVRELSKAMHEAFSRSQSQSTEDPDLALAKSRFNYDHNKWLLPASESEYRDGIRYLQAYLERLTDVDEYNAQFYARADNLNYWLRVVESNLGSLSQRLSASVGQRRLNIDLAGDTAARQSTPAPNEIEVKTPWYKVDDVFYEARGSTWALMQFLKAVEVDFEQVLRKKNAQVSLRQIIRELEASQEPVYSPVILNGSGFGVLANHSLVMASYISRANAALINLRELLAQG